MNIGIDLGTTNSALAYIDPQQAAEADTPAIRADDAIARRNRSHATATESPGL